MNLLQQYESLLPVITRGAFVIAAVVLVALVVYGIMNWRLLRLRHVLRPWFAEEGLTHDVKRQKSDGTTETVTVYPRVVHYRRLRDGFSFVVVLKGRVSLRLLIEKRDSLAEHLNVEKVEVSYLVGKRGLRPGRALVEAHWHDSAPAQFTFDDFRSHQ